MQDDICIEHALRSGLPLGCCRTAPLSKENLQDVLCPILYPDNPGLVASNHTFHTFLIGGGPVEYLVPDGHIVTEWSRLVD